jgi:hypothetical protein
MSSVVITLVNLKRDYRAVDMARHSRPGRRAQQDEVIDQQEVHRADSRKRANSQEPMIPRSRTELTR